MTSTEIKNQAEAYIQSKGLLNPYEAYEGFIAGFNAALKVQSKIVLQEILKARETDSQKITQLTESLQREKEKNSNAGPGNNNGNGNGGNNGNNGNGNGNNGHGNNGNGNGNGGK